MIMTIQPHHISAAYGKPPFSDLTLVIIALSCFLCSFGV